MASLRGIKLHGCVSGTICYVDGNQITHTTQQFALCQHQHVLAGEQITAPSTSICITVTLATQRTRGR